MGKRFVALMVAVLVVAAACTSEGAKQGATDTSRPGNGGTQPGVTTTGCSTSSGAAGNRPTVDSAAKTTKPTFTVTAGVEQLTVTGAAPKAKLTLVGPDSHKILTLVADDKGQAVFAYVPDDYLTAETGNGDGPPTSKGQPLHKCEGGYTIRNESADPAESSDPINVLNIDDHAPESLYDGQKLNTVHWAIVGGKPPEGSKPADGFGYITMRDGVKLSATIRLPDESVYGPGPYPTVVEYSGYAPSNPDGPEPGTTIATSLGFATVGVNMRGSGCSGGVFDIFNPAQQADGYDVIETVARQPWVLNHKVGMVGLSYSGISQLFVASTQPPSLAAITPLSVIEDPWKMSYPGGIYNAGFTKQWLAERDRGATAGGQAWDQKRMDGGDTECRENQELRSQNIDFQKFAHSLEFRPRDDDERDLSLLVKKITVPVYLSGAWQDEQTGPRFATMLENFTGTQKKHFVLYNGHHPDGYSPLNLSRWLEFLQLYVGKQVPKVSPLVRFGAPQLFEDNFGVKDLNFSPDRFTDLEGKYDEALARWEAEPQVLVRFEMGAGMADVPGAPIPRYEATFPSWPPPNLEAGQWYFGTDGALSTSKPTGDGIDSYQFDPDVGLVGYASAGAYDFIKPTVKIDWKNTAPGKGLSYVTEPLAEDTVIAGPGYADLWFKSDADDANIEIVLSEITADGNEFRIQNGVLRAGNRKVDESRSNEFLIQETFAEADYQKLPKGELTEVKVPIFPVAHALRKGSRLRVQINTPGGDLPLWFFENKDDGNKDAHEYVSRSADKPSSVVLPLLPAGIVTPVAGYPPCPSLRGQPCRTYVPLANAAG
jgi:predicted acyl esterase